MSLSRRIFLAGGLATIAGCAASQDTGSGGSSLLWPEPDDTYASRSARSRSTRQPSRYETDPEPVSRAASSPHANTDVAIPFRAIPRGRWASQDPIPTRLNPMRQVARITVHHEGWKPVWFSDAKTTAARLDLIRKSHINRMRAGDIGYHFIVDRAGRVWEGRSLRYQGAHVRANNEFNIGVMCLGNFDKQSPSSRQLLGLQNTLALLMKRYRVPLSQVKTHQEINPTACPGKNLQPRVAALRSNGHLA